MAYKELSTKYPSMINSFAHSQSDDKLTKILNILPDMSKIQQKLPFDIHDEPNQKNDHKTGFPSSLELEKSLNSKLKLNSDPEIENQLRSNKGFQPICNELPQSKLIPENLLNSIDLNKFNLQKPKLENVVQQSSIPNKKDKPEEKVDKVEKNTCQKMTIKNKMIKDVKPITSIIKQKSKWNFQKEKTGSLQHQLDSHRAYEFDHSLVKINEKKERVELIIDRIHGVNYFKYIKGNKDLFNEITETCNCEEYNEIIKCKKCNKKKFKLGSRSTGIKYNKLELPKWNLTFKAGGLRSEHRVFHGTYKVRARSDLQENCQSFITFSMLLPKKDPHHPNLGFWEEIALGFSSKSNTSVSLFIKSSSSETEKKELMIPIKIKTKDNSFSIKNYNNYTLEWKENNIKLLVNSKTVYETKIGDPIPQMPGFTYLLIRPNYDTHSVNLFKKIKKEIYPNMHIKSFCYTPYNEDSLSDTM